VILAARLGDAARAGEILLSRRTRAAVDDRLVDEPMPDLDLRGFSRPVVATRLISVPD
jgi:class 3 adenylate cyclase